MSMDDTWDEVEYASDRIIRAMEAGRTAEALDRMNTFKQKFGKSFSEYQDDKESEAWAKDGR